MTTRVTIKLPADVYKKLAQLIADSGFSSVTQFIVFVMRTVLMNVEENDTPTTAEIGQITRNIRRSSYFGEIREASSCQAPRRTKNTGNTHGARGNINEK